MLLNFLRLSYSMSPQSHSSCTGWWLSIAFYTVLLYFKVYQCFAIWSVTLTWFCKTMLIVVVPSILWKNNMLMYHICWQLMNWFYQKSLYILRNYQDHSSWNIIFFKILSLDGILYQSLTEVALQRLIKLKVGCSSFVVCHLFFQPKYEKY